MLLLYPSLCNGRAPSASTFSHPVCFFYIIVWEISGSRSEASSRHPLCCLAPTGSSLYSSPNVLFLINAFTYFTEMYHIKNSCYCQADLNFILRRPGRPSCPAMRPDGHKISVLSHTEPFSYTIFRLFETSTVSEVPGRCISHTQQPQSERHR